MRNITYSYERRSVCTSNVNLTVTPAGRSLSRIEGTISYLHVSKQTYCTTSELTIYM